MMAKTTVFANSYRQALTQAPRGCGKTAAASNSIPTANLKSNIAASRGETAATAKGYLSRTSPSSHTNVVMLWPAALHSAVNIPSDTRNFRGLA